MPTWKLTIEYEGTRYRGWQEQPNARTVAGEIRRAGERVLGAKAGLAGAGRTDAGVHALGQVARLSSSRDIAVDQLVWRVNDLLPADINLLQAERVDPRFDPRRDAVARYYLYQISTRRTAFAKRFVWWIRDDLDFDAMSAAVSSLPGKHDFALLCERSEDQRSTSVHVEVGEIGRRGDLILVRIGASHFLWKMVRRIVGAIVEVGRSKLSVADFRGLIHGRADVSFDVAGHTAPPSGLFLERVSYARGSKVSRLEPAFEVRRYIHEDRRHR